jgi:hypothetical protein
MCLINKDLTVGKSNDGLFSLESCFSETGKTTGILVECSNIENSPKFEDGI